MSFKSKMHAIGDEVLDGVLEAVGRAEHESGRSGDLARSALCRRRQSGKQVARPARPASSTCSKDRWPSSSKPRWQSSTRMVPTVAAVQGMALGGGCEFVMHASHRVLALESYVGLVEAGVGLIPAGGGCKEFALQAAMPGQPGGRGAMSSPSSRTCSRPSPWPTSPRAP
jgi:3-hydroxyacyl-CoA dehydrogenase